MKHFNIYVDVYMNGNLKRRLSLGQLKKLSTEMIIKALYVSLLYNTKQLVQEKLGELISSVEEKRISPDWLEDHPDEVTLKAAYEKAINASVFGNTGMSIIDKRVLDDLLPMHGEDNDDSIGWWRLHELGGGLVGASSDFGFVRLRGRGRFGQGLMLPVSDKVKPFSGFRPKRYLRNFILDVKEELMSIQFKDRVFNMAGDILFNKVNLDE